MDGLLDLDSDLDFFYRNLNGLHVIFAAPQNASDEGDAAERHLMGPPLDAAPAPLLQGEDPLPLSSALPQRLLPPVQDHQETDEPPPPPPFSWAMPPLNSVPRQMAPGMAEERLGREVQRVTDGGAGSRLDGLDGLEDVMTADSLATYHRSALSSVALQHFAQVQSSLVFEVMTDSGSALCVQCI